mmetsp:Transcript_22381/g.67047  ORF Transcript_22381/g.67047 Transcript_22381/m.67047 type:complete len:193 (-) Transcript_22381:13-591(-)
MEGNALLVQFLKDQKARAAKRRKRKPVIKLILNEFTPIHPAAAIAIAAARAKAIRDARRTVRGLSEAQKAAVAAEKLGRLAPCGTGAQRECYAALVHAIAKAHSVAEAQAHAWLVRHKQHTETLTFGAGGPSGPRGPRTKPYKTRKDKGGTRTKVYKVRSDKGKTHASPKVRSSGPRTTVYKTRSDKGKKRG